MWCAYAESFIIWKLSTVKFTINISSTTDLSAGDQGNIQISEFLQIDVTFCSEYRGREQEQHLLQLQFNLPDDEIKLYSSAPPVPAWFYSCASMSEQMNQTNSPWFLYLFIVVCAIFSDICSSECRSFTKRRGRNKQMTTENWTL